MSTLLLEMALDPEAESDRHSSAEILQLMWNAAQVIMRASSAKQWTISGATLQ
jgi:hypothetical protein